MRTHRYIRLVLLASSVLVLKLSNGSVLAQLTGIPVARGVAVADSIGSVFVTSSPDTLVQIDSQSLGEVRRVKTGSGPDGVAWDSIDRVVGVSDQRDGALSLIGDAGAGTRTQVPLGAETGNVVYDSGRHLFWVTVVNADMPDQLVAVDPKTAHVKTTIDVPGCSGAHGLRLHPNGESAFIACEQNNTLARVELSGGHSVQSAATGSGPDVLVETIVAKRGIAIVKSAGLVDFWRWGAAPS